MLYAVKRIKNNTAYLLDEDRIEAITWWDAEHKLRQRPDNENCTIAGEIIMEIPADDNWNPLWEQTINYEQTKLN
ncbi:MAG: hypothetical protein LBE91_08140 [Tannerella sp.]|jgi:hypothetical protein|nr:hypothetical protein [Tannerella sp.]